MANEVLCKYETHQPLLDAHVNVDFVFAYANVDPDTGLKIGYALKLHGRECTGIARKIQLKDRVKGMGDAEISLDGDWWEQANDEERRALLDHELHHLMVKIDKRGLVRDDIGRPVIVMRPHDVEFGWFKVIAARHGMASQERQQAAIMMSDAGQYFWPQIFEIVKDNPKLLGDAEPVVGKEPTL
jgi:hypothetical protein